MALKEKVDKINEFLAETRKHLTRAFDVAITWDLFDNSKEKFKELFVFFKNNLETQQDRLENNQVTELDSMIIESQTEEDLIRKSIEEKRSIYNNAISQAKLSEDLAIEREIICEGACEKVDEDVKDNKNEDVKDKTRLEKMSLEQQDDLIKTIYETSKRAINSEYVDFNEDFRNLKIQEYANKLLEEYNKDTEDEI